MLPAGSAAAAAPPRPTPPSATHTQAAAPAAATVTLITGDVVHITAGRTPTVTVDRAPGAGGAVHVQQFGGDTYVVPDEAQSLLAAGTLDRRLFDVTALVAMGYDDAHSTGVPLIATWTKAARTARSLPAAPAGTRTVRTLPSIGGAALSADKKHARAFWDDLDPAATGRPGTTGAKPARSLDATNGIARLWLDARATAALHDSVAQIGAPQAWAQGDDGTGEKVAVLDTGVDDTHPDLQGKVAEEQSFVPGQAVADGNGHGTHVASTIAGSGAASGGLEKGVAPGARLLVGKVLSDQGEGQDSWIIAGMEWAKAQGADVVSMSLGNPVPDDGTDPMAQAVDNLSADGGPLFVIAAGNSYTAGSIGAPGSARSALTVAAVDGADQRADFSSMGPLTGSYSLKPDLSAPGVDITAAKPGGGYQSMSGTSMATPHIAGAAAVLKQRHPDWSAARLKDALMSSSTVLDGYTPFEQGAGRVDVLSAVDSAVQATGSVDTAVFRWPNAWAAAVTRTLTYRNSGTTPVTLKLATSTAGAAYTLSAGTVTVPAGGSSDVTLTLDPAPVPAGTTFSGQVLATDVSSGTLVAHTAFGLVKEKELYDYTIKLLGRDGKPTAGTVIVAQDGSPTPAQVPVDGQATLRLAPGTYMAYAEIDVPGDTPDSLGLALVADPETVLTKDTTVTLDASRAHRISASVPQRTQVRQLNWDLARTFADGRLVRDVAMLPLTYDALYASPTHKVTDGTFSFLTRWRLGEPTVAVTDRGTGLDTTTQPGAPVTDGSAVLPTAYAGTGTAADYAGRDVRGKAVVVDRSDAVTPADRAANAAAAGAKLLIVVNDGRGRLLEGYAADDGSEAPLPVVSIRHDAGARLAAEAARGARVQVTQRQYTRYVYDLLDQHDGTIPDRSLAYTPDPRRDLATVTAAYDGDRARLGGGYRYDIPVWGPGVGFTEQESYPSTRTEYVSAEHDAGFWYEDHSVYSAGYQDQLLEERGGEDTFLPGHAYRTTWFGGVYRPRLGTAFWGPTRSSYNDIQFNITPWTDGGAGHSGDMPADEYDGRTTYAAYQGDTLVAHGVGRAAGMWDMPARTLPYRLVIDSARDAAAWKTSVRTHTEWNFVSGPVAGDALVPVKLLQLDYAVATDTADDVPAGRWTTIGLSSATQEWLDSVTRASSATLSVSYDDGAHWQPVTLDAQGKGAWTARIRTPKTPGGAVSLRATASDGHGGSVSQEIIRAFGLK
ncbi:S8 family serine peptidase [Streptomyces sp. PLK6-54]|uniref:S8 family serine peptidase n=2 Tax=Actinacidiphila acidipaludis TaxID=2873382 RepID=A0ABS7QBS2_9ACTN|nr:S8 family serine peptidase [Streptomyces acidipaludis]MBY8879239.1 S8 family serine peptidase [Streptomyces acidipaludis]